MTCQGVSFIFVTVHMQNTCSAHVYIKYFTHVSLVIIINNTDLNFLSLLLCFSCVFC
ncbi:hypothetical protein Pint_26788 [Pistacia integerrima]|uniref:Uncharacterized protein n=1 Tax=Pistacia integerrima TaxID=434235 RepID=A0ACC0YTK6_9ROSI|nr:hypothetical protein Pint_26788 [Pistacia integerrima]